MAEPRDPPTHPMIADRFDEHTLKMKEDIGHDSKRQRLQVNKYGAVSADIVDGKSVEPAGCSSNKKQPSRQTSDFIKKFTKILDVSQCTELNKSSKSSESNPQNFPILILIPFHILRKRTILTSSRGPTRATPSRSRTSTNCATKFSRFSLSQRATSNLSNRYVSFLLSCI